MSHSKGIADQAIDEHTVGHFPIKAGGASFRTHKLVVVSPGAFGKLRADAEKLGRFLKVPV